MEHSSLQDRNPPNEVHKPLIQDISTPTHRRSWGSDVSTDDNKHASNIRLSPVHSHSASIFFPDGLSTCIRHQIKPQLTTASSSSRLPPTMSGLSKGTSRLSARVDAGLSSSTCPANVEKAADDPNTPSRRIPLQRVNTPTTTTLNRLFTAQAAPSPISSRAASYNQHASDVPYMRAITSEMASLPAHLHNRGLLEGRHSDIIVKVFGNEYRLHRIVLDRAPFFASALSEPWIEASAKDITLHPEETDCNITKTAFELALKRLYGCHDANEENDEAIALFATGSWLEMQDLIDASVECILQNLHPRTLSPIINLFTTNYYGKAGEQLLASAKAMISRDGWEMPVKCWDGIPSEVIRELVGGDGLFIRGEWERWVLAKRLLDRRLKSVAIEAGIAEIHSKFNAPESVRRQAVRPLTSSRQVSTCVHSSKTLRDWHALYTHPDIEPLLVLLDEGIHYVHLEFEQLQYVRSALDAFGIPLLPEKIIANALWMNMELRQKVLNAKEKDLELNLSHVTDVSNTGLVRQSMQYSSRATSPNKPGVKTTQDADDLSVETKRASLADIESHRKFWIPSCDCNIVIGGAEPVSTASNARDASRLSTAFRTEDMQWFSDFVSERPLSSGQEGAESLPKSYSRFPPFRFAAEFPNPRLLREKKRVYSRTVFYAGSLWNVYIQKVRTGGKSPQLGVYLHRAKEREIDDTIAGTGGLSKGSVDERIGALEREMLLRSDRTRGDHQQHQLDSTLPDQEVVDTSGSGNDTTLIATTPARGPGSGLSTFMARTGRKSSHRISLPIHMNQEFNWTDPATRVSAPSRSSSSEDEGVEDLLESTRRFQLDSYTPTLPNYVDARPTIKTYFKIYSPSKGGKMLNVYESAPDNFNFSQSWGWKSSTLMLGENSLEDGEDETIRMGEVGEEELEGQKDGVGRRKNHAKLRFMVVLGVV